MTTSEEVSYVSTSLIQPASTSLTSQGRRIELTKWDLQLLPYLYTQRGLLFSTSKQQEAGLLVDDMISHLKTSLSKTLDHFFPLAGRLAITEHDNFSSISVYIDCNSAGAEFIHATANLTIADILNPTYVPSIVCSFFPLNGVINLEGRSKPLLSIQVTQLIDGLFIGSSMNHSVCDGTSFCHFLNSWSKISRSSTNDPIIEFPVIEPCFLNDTHCPIRLPFSYNELFKLKYIPTPFKARVFHFEPKNIARLKEKANLEIKTKGGSRRVSSLQALFAHLWVAVVHAQCLEPTENTRFVLAMGNRARLNPPLHESYFGNSLDMGIATSNVKELLEKGIGYGASVLNEVIMSHNDAKIRCSWDSWVEKPAYLISNRSIGPKFATLWVGGSVKFDLYGNDFGWGQPIAVRSGLSSKSNGMIMASPGSVEGSVDVEVCLPLEVFHAMVHDSEFMDFVTEVPPFRSGD